MVKFTLVNFHGYGGKNKDDPSPTTIGSTKKIGGYILVYLKLCFVCPSQKNAWKVSNTFLRGPIGITTVKKILPFFP